jgi:hypothetical protein
MSKFIVEIRTDNAAYEEDFYDEIIANLKNICQQVDSSQLEGIVKDTNGNKVGKFYCLTDGEGGN